MCVCINISSIYMDIELEDLSYKQKILKKKNKKNCWKASTFTKGIQTLKPHLFQRYKKKK